MVKERATARFSYSGIYGSLLSEDGLTSHTWVFRLTDAGIQVDFVSIEERSSTRHRSWYCTREGDTVYNNKGGREELIRRHKRNRFQRALGELTSDPTPEAPPEVWAAAQRVHMDKWDKDRTWALQRWSDAAREKELALFSSSTAVLKEDK